VDFATFKRKALTTLVGHQQHNGSWFDDPVATISAIEALTEECGGPDPVCRFSGLHKKLDRGDEQPTWLLRFSWGLSTNSDDPNAPYIASTYGGMRWARREVNSIGDPNLQNAWVLSKWVRTNVLTDADFQVIRTNLSKLASVETEESWLLAYIGQAILHNNAYFDALSRANLTRRPDLLGFADRLLNLMNSDHWDSGSVTAEEATAIVGAFLFHTCMFRLSIGHLSKHEIQSVRDAVLNWSFTRQMPSGAWAESPHVTAHCMKFLDAVLVDLPPEHPQRAKCTAALKQSIRYLLQPEVQALWTPVGSYQQIDVLAALIRLTKRPALTGMLVSSAEVDGSVYSPEVFISYGGPDAAFAKRLAKDIEAAGIRVWFAEWDLDYGDDVVEEISNGLSATSKFLIVLSPKGIQRPWVRKELSAAFQQALSGPGKLILPVMYRQCQPPPSWLHTAGWTLLSTSSMQIICVN
jgi:hypothetical protein